MRSTVRTTFTIHQSNSNINTINITSIINLRYVDYYYHKCQFGSIKGSTGRASNLSKTRSFREHGCESSQASQCVDSRICFIPVVSLACKTSNFDTFNQKRTKHRIKGILLRFTPCHKLGAGRGGLVRRAILYVPEGPRDEYLGQSWSGTPNYLLVFDS